MLMKRILLLLLSLAALSGQVPEAAARSVPEQRLVNIVNGFRGTEGFEVVKIGRFGVWLMRSAAGLSEAGGDPEFRQALKVMNGVRRLVVVEYEDGSERERGLFNDRISSALRNSVRAVSSALKACWMNWHSARGLDCVMIFLLS